MKVIIYREVDGRLEKVQTEDVPDTSTDPEGTAWSAATRRTGVQALPAGRYTLHRGGKRYRRDSSTTWTNVQVGTAV